MLTDTITWRILFFVLPVMMLVSCYPSEDIDQRFFLESDKAVMPVVVRGNISSGVMMIMLHGGPGGTAVRDYQVTHVFEELEKKYGFVYWDQRCAGLSQGNCDTKTVLIDDYVRDLDKLIVLVKHFYGEDLSIFLLGHSWGGTLSMAYALADNNQEKLKGIINTSGPHDFNFTLLEEQRVMLDFGNKMIDGNVKSDSWQKVVSRVEPLDPTSFTGARDLNILAYSTAKILLEMDSVNAMGVSFPLAIQLSTLFPVLVHAQANGNFNNDFYDEFLVYDLSDQLSQLRIPSAFYAGKYDFVVPSTILKDAFEKTGSTNKEWHLFERSDHLPMFQEREEYQKVVESFVEKYR